MADQLPQSDVDMWSDATLGDPYPVYRELRDMGSVVYLARHDLYAVMRYADAKYVAANWLLFSSASGIAFNDAMNGDVAGTLIGSDPPLHGRYRAILERPLLPREIKQVRERISDMAGQLTGQLAGRSSIEVMSELASPLPVKIVADLVGLPQAGRDAMLGWASRAINALAPMGANRVADGMAQLSRMDAYFGDETLVANVRQGSWADRLGDSLRAGEIDRTEFRNLLQINYVLPALDTTIHAIGNIIWLLAQLPEVWAHLRDNRQLVGRAIHEAMRLSGPVQSFSRVTTRDIKLGGSTIPAGKRIYASWASANRDERHYPDPDAFDLTRDSADHLGFGHGTHMCLGRNLATMELTALLTSLLDHAVTIALVGAKPMIHNALYGFSELTIAVG